MSSFVGTRTLLRLALRRDRIWLPVWLVALVAFAWLEVEALTGVYGTSQGAYGYAKTAASSLPARMFGSIDGATTGAVTMVELWVFVSILVGLMQSLLVVRHTRKDEAAGRLELVRSAAVGRHAGLAAALIVSVLSCIVLGGCFAGVLIVAGQLPVAGSLAMAAGWCGVGIVFGATAGVAAQLAPTPRMATGLVGIALGAAFLIRMVGDIIGSVSADGLSVRIAWPSWLSPIGWTQLAYPFGAQRWWAMLPYVVAPVVLYVVAFALSARRDVGRGLLREPHGRARATRWLTSPLALALRLDRGLIIGWAVGFAIVGAVCGAFVDEIDSMVAENEQARELFAALGGTDVLSDAYLAIMNVYLGVFAAALAVQIAARLHAEEQGPGEIVLATGTSRARWMSSHLVVALAGSVLVLAIGASAMLVTALSTGVEGITRTVTLGMLVQVPALLAFIGVVALGFGVSSRWGAILGWGLFSVAVFVLLGQIIDLPEWVQQLSPFTHVPLVPVEDIDAAPLVGLTAFAAVTTAIGYVSFTRRNVDAGA